jgi:hypothetical protein
LLIKKYCSPFCKLSIITAFENERGRLYREINIKFSFGNLEEKDFFKDIGVDKRIILKPVLKK